MITIEGLIKFYTPYHYIGLLALVVAVYVYITKKKTFPLFIPFLFVNSFVEMYLVYYFGIKIKNSLVVYNYFTILVILYYFYVYYDFFKSKSWSKYIVLVAVIWIIYVIYVISNEDMFINFKNYYLIGLFIISILIFIFFKGILESKDLTDITTLPIFYFSLGILLLFFSSLTILAFPDKLLINSESNLYPLLIIFSNFLLNLGYLGTALCVKKN